MLLPNTSYHIYNHANGFENVFLDDDNFRYFLMKYRHHISPIAETYAYCLMPNHFHLVVRVRRKEVIAPLFLQNLQGFKNLGGLATPQLIVTEDQIIRYLSQQFSNLFNAYTKAFNKRFNRRGSLFTQNFHRKPITDKEHFLNMLIYTHRNPIHHGFCTQFDQWEFSSYNEIVDGCCDWLETEKLLKLTDGLDNFIGMHQQNLAEFGFESEDLRK